MGSCNSKCLWDINFCKICRIKCCAYSKAPADCECDLQPFISNSGYCKLCDNRFNNMINILNKQEKYKDKKDKKELELILYTWHSI